MSDQRPAILIIEDNGIIARNIRAILMVKFRVLPVVANAGDALQQISREKPDVIIMDIMLEGDIDGVELTRRIKAQHRDIAVIYVTGIKDEAVLTAARATNPIAILPKPVYSKAIIESIEKALHRA